MAESMNEVGQSAPVLEARLAERRAVMSVVYSLSAAGSPDLARETTDVLSDIDMPDGAPVLHLALGAREEDEFSSAPRSRREMRERQQPAPKRGRLFGGR